MLGRINTVSFNSKPLKISTSDRSDTPIFTHESLGPSFESFITINLYLTENIHPALLIWPLSYLVFEFLSVNLIRIIDNKALFKAGNYHFHYLLKKKFKINNYFVIIIISTITIFTSLICFFINQKLPPDYSLLIFIFLFIVYFLLRFKFHYLIKNI